MAFKPTKRTRRDTAFKKLKAQQQVFVASVVAGNNTTQAALDAGYGGPLKRRGIAAVAGNKLMNNPKVQNALAEKLKEAFPTGETALAEMIKQVLEYPLEQMGYKECPVKMADKMKAAELYMKILGYEAPKVTRHERRNLSLSAKVSSGGEQDGEGTRLLPKISKKRSGGK